MITKALTKDLRDKARKLDSYDQRARDRELRARAREVERNGKEGLPKWLLRTDIPLFLISK